MFTPPSSLPDWLVAAIASGLTALIAWARGRSKEAKELERTNAQVEAAELENVEKAISIWRQLANEMIKHVDNLKQEVQDLTSQVKLLHNENETLRTQVSKLQYENKRLEQRVEQITEK